MFSKSEKESAQSSSSDIPTTPAPVPSRSSVNEPKVVARAVIGASLHFKGDLSGNEDLEVHGRFEGTIKLKQNNLTVGKQGSVQANVRAKIINVEGTIEGDLTGDERVLVRESGNVRGNIIAPRVSLEDGAKFKGSIDMEPKAEHISKSNRPNNVSTAAPSTKDSSQKQIGVQAKSA